MTFPLPDHPLPGQGVTLRVWEAADADWYISARDEEIFRWTTEPPHLEVEALRRVIEANRREPKFAGFAIVDASTGDLLGNIALVMKNQGETAEVSYWLAANARGRGAASEAVRTIARWAFDVLPIERIELLTHPQNRNSQRVAVSAGFAQVGLRGERLLYSLPRRPD